jgi:hypothetical protein
MKANDFEVLKIDHLKQLLTVEGRSIMAFDHQLKTNNAFVYYLKSGYVLLLPNNMYDNKLGLKFKNPHIFDHFLKNETFPIKNSNPSIEEAFQNETVNVDTRVSMLLKYFKRLYSLPKSQMDLKQLLKSLQSKDFKVGSKKYLAARLLLGEEIRQHIHGRWILLKQFGPFNPYFIPAIVNDQKGVIEIMSIANLYFSDTFIEMDSFLKLPFIKKPSLTIGTPYFQERFQSYIIKERPVN